MRMNFGRGFRFFDLEVLILIQLWFFYSNESVNSSEIGLTWVMSKDICIDTRCSCAQVNTSHISIKCNCMDHSQVVNLVSGEEKSVSEEITFVIDNCSYVKVQPNALSALHGTRLNIHLTNIPHLEILETAFEISKQVISRNIYFDHVHINKIPAKAFPSSLNNIQFINCTIGIIESLAFKGKTLQSILLEESSVELIQSKAFDEEILINNSWTVVRSVVGEIEEHGIEASITSMTWIESEILRLGSYSMSGTIPIAIFLKNTFRYVPTNGLTLKDWTRLSFLNNTFDRVDWNGLDLTQHSALFNISLISGNNWKDVDKDFIKVGVANSTPFTIVRNNRLLAPCNCSLGFFPQVTLNGSTVWFQEEVWSNSECLTTQKAAECLGRTDLTQLFVSYNEWDTFCSEETFLCINEVTIVKENETDIDYTPPLTGKLRTLAIFVGTVGLAIGLALLCLLCVYVCRKEKIQDEKSGIKSNGIEDGTHTLSPSNHNYILRSKGSLPTESLDMRPRSIIFEDVEMEDKGVQTMPSNLSTEVLDGLREKLTNSDSFWNAKETVDHLYDLIHVREDMDSSPPDVTVRSPNTGQKSSTTTTTTTTMSTPVNPSKPPHSTPRYAQIRSKPKSQALSSYKDLTDTPSHIYSELSEANGGAGRRKEKSPFMCDYTEPRDAQTHVYAELNSCLPTYNPRPLLNHGRMVFSLQHRAPIPKLPIPPPKPPVHETKADSQQRPLPTIPPPTYPSTLK